MLTRIRTWQVLAWHLLLAACATGALAHIIHFPDVARRPMPPPKTLFFTCVILFSIATLGFRLAGVRSAQADTGVVLLGTGILWLLGCYGLVFVWINTFGT